MEKTLFEKSEKKLIKNNSKLLFSFLTALISFFLSQFGAIEGFSPFSCAFVSAVSSEYCFAAFLGSATGCFLSLSWQEALKYLFSLGVVCAFRLFILKRTSSENSLLALCVISFCSCLCASVGYMAFSGFDFLTAVKGLCEAAVSAFSVAVYKRAVAVPVLSIGLKRLSAQDAASLVFCLCVFFMCAAGMILGFVSPARIAAAVIVIFAAQYKGVAVAAVSGVCAGLSFCVYENHGFMLALFSLGALTAGLFSSLGQYTTAISFALTASCASLVSGFDKAEIGAVAEVIIAAGVYSLIPPSWIISAQDYLSKNALMKDSDIERQVCANLNLAAGKVEEVSDIVMRVGERLDRVINPEINQVFSKMQQGLCLGCDKKSECWNRYFSETAFDIMVMAGIQKGSAKKTALEKRCIRPMALLEEVNKHYPDFVSAVATKVKISEMRDILSEQFLSVALFLSETAKNASFSGIVDKAKSRSIKTALSDSAVETDALRYMTDLSGKVSVEAVIYEKNAFFDTDKMKAIIEFVTARKFERPEIAVMETKTEILFEEKARYKIKYGSAQIAFSKSKVCGDNIGYTKDLQSNEYAFLSDGMGTGARAAIDAAMTCGLLEKLLACGFSFESALKVINSSLMLKSTDESLATVDAVCINVYSGEAVFYKAGATVSFIRRGNKVSVVEEVSMPIGIIKSVSATKTETQLQKGDIILLVSDGVTTGDCGWISDELLAWSTGNMNDLATHIASLARLRSDKRCEDDITVVSVKLSEN
ncbi:MAG: SpoIIE family protein phosphatase [Clostridia bacterium]|nr:SpoIIE family protein phosphatase [Clostridia bacterium]